MSIIIDEIESYDLKEVCEKLSISRQTVMKYCRSGEIKANKIGGVWRVTKESLKSFLQGQS